MCEDMSREERPKLAHNLNTNDNKGSTKLDGDEYFDAEEDLNSVKSNHRGSEKLRNEKRNFALNNENQLGSKADHELQKRTSKKKTTNNSSEINLNATKSHENNIAFSKSNLDHGPNTQYFTSKNEQNGEKISVLKPQTRNQAQVSYNPEALSTDELLAIALTNETNMKESVKEFFEIQSNSPNIQQPPLPQASPYVEKIIGINDEIKNEIKDLMNSVEENEKENTSYTELYDNIVNTDEKSITSSSESKQQNVFCHMLGAFGCTIIIAGIITGLILRFGKTSDYEYDGEPYEAHPDPFHTIENECVQGRSISMSNDGNRILYNSIGSGAWKILVYNVERNHTDVVYSLSTNLVISETYLSISGDGKTVVFNENVAQENSSSSSDIRAKLLVYHEINDGIWKRKGPSIRVHNITRSQVFSLALNYNGHFLGIGVPLSNEYGILAGEAHLLLYDRYQNVWVDVNDDIGEKSYLTGESVAISDSGLTFAVSSPGARGGGEVKIGRYNASTYVEAHFYHLRADDMSEIEDYGASVSLDNSGTLLAIGAPSSNFQDSVGVGKCFIYQYEGKKFLQKGNSISGQYPMNNFGFLVSLSGDGSRVAIASFTNSSSYSTKVQIYENLSGSWMQVERDFFQSIFGFGASIALNSNGSIFATSATGENNCGKIFLYQIPHSTDTEASR